MTVIVVGAAILDGDCLLAARRSAPAELAGGWELPGGKVEVGESDVDALVRECSEELGIVIVPGYRVGGDWRMSGNSVLRVWTASVVGGKPIALEHSELRWLALGHWYDVAWLPVDLPVVRELERLVG